MSATKNDRIEQYVRTYGARELAAMTVEVEDAYDRARTRVRKRAPAPCEHAAGIEKLRAEYAASYRRPESYQYRAGLRDALETLGALPDDAAEKRAKERT